MEVLSAPVAQFPTELKIGLQYPLLKTLNNKQFFHMQSQNKLVRK